MEIRHRVSVWGSIVAGAAAWLALNAFARVAAPLFGVSFGLTGHFFGSLLFPSAGMIVQVWIGRLVFLGAAIVWGLLYRWAGRYLPGPGWYRGLLYGAGIWLISGVALPVIGVIHPLVGNVFPSNTAFGTFPGFLGLGFAGGAGLALSVLAHLVFGMTLGTLTSIQERRT